MGALAVIYLAQGLRKAGHGVTVFERDADLDRKVGYRLHMSADGGEALRRCLPDAHDAAAAARGRGRQ